MVLVPIAIQDTSMPRQNCLFPCCYVFWTAIWTLSCYTISSNKTIQDSNMLFSAIIMLVCSGLAAAAGSPCSSTPYKSLLYLSTYPPAESYCTAHYPLATKTITSAVIARAAGRKRIPGQEPRAPAVISNLVWLSLVAKGGSVLSTFCSCIETQPVVTATVSIPFQQPNCSAAVMLNTKGLVTRD